MRPKTLWACFIVALAGFAAAYWLGSRQAAERAAAELADQQAAWASEKALLEAALAVKPPPRIIREPPPAPPTPMPPGRLSPAEIVQRLAALRLTAGTENPRQVRQAVKLFEDLIERGPTALPAIRAFLDRFEDADFETDGKGLRRSLKEGRLPTDFVLPPSLRIGLLDTVRQIGGPESEQILAEVLGTTGRGLEVAYLARVLQELAPDRYRSLALTAARDLLVNPPAYAQPTRLDKGDREFLFSVLALYQDTSFASVVQNQLVQADGSVDYSSLRYLRSALGEQALPTIAQALHDPRLKEPDQKEPLLDYIALYAGLNPQANELLASVAKDTELPLGLRVNSIVNLYKVGINEDQPSAADREVIQARLQVLAGLRPEIADQQLTRHIDKIERGLSALLAGPEPSERPGRGKGK